MLGLRDTISKPGVCQFVYDDVHQSAVTSKKSGGKECEARIFLQFFNKNEAVFCSRDVGHTMPPYGKEGGSTRRSYTPNLYGATTFSSAAKNLRDSKSPFTDADEGYLPASVFAKFPVCGVDQFWFCPYATCPVFTLNPRKWAVSYVPAGNCNQVRWDWDRLYLVK